MSFEIDDTPYDSVLDALNKCNEAVIKALDAMQGAINAKADSQTNVTTSQEILEDIENKKTSIENDKLEVEATLAEVQNLASALAIISTNISNNTTVVSTVKEEILLKLSNINDLIYTISGMASSAVPGEGAVANGQVFTLSDSDISRKYVSVSEIIIDNQSVMVFIEGAGILAEVGVDYSVSGQDIFWTYYALEGILSVGDKLRIIYN